MIEQIVYEGEEPKMVSVGVQVRESAPRNVIEAPVLLRYRQKNKDGSEVEAEQDVYDTAGSAVISVRREMLPVERVDTRNFTFQKYVGRLKQVQTRFVDLPAPVATKMRGAYGDWLDIRYVKSKDLAAYHRAQPGPMSKGNASEEKDSLPDLLGKGRPQRWGDRPRIEPDSRHGAPQHDPDGQSPIELQIDNVPVEYSGGEIDSTPEVATSGASS